MTCQMTMSLGVYVLGAADAAEQQRMAAHLPGCRDCQAELARLTPLPALLTQVSPGMLSLPRQPRHAAPPAPRAPARRRPWFGRPVRAAAAAASVAAAAGLAGGFWLASAGPPSRPRPTLTLHGENRATHVEATAALTATSWGASIQLRLSGLPLNVPCRLIVRSRHGGTEVAGVWDAWRDGPISVPGSAGWRPGDIASLQVATASRTLITISSARG
jgi:hypothetical protein